MGIIQLKSIITKILINWCVQQHSRDDKVNEHEDQSIEFSSLTTERKLTEKNSCTEN